MVKVGIIGCGHWGPNHARIFSQLPNSQTVMCADLSEDRLNAMKKLLPGVEVTKDYKDIYKNSEIDAVCIAAPTKIHYTLTKEALNAGKHVLCEKPLTLNPDEAKELGELAQAKGLVLIVGHIFLFNAGILWLKKFIDSGELGEIFYAYATRTNLGPFRYDVNALWDLAPHDISIFNYLFDACPQSVSATGHKYLGNSLEDVAFAKLNYANNISASVHVSWLDPKKVRQITLVGDKKMVIWDDMDSVGPIKIYDKHVERTATFYDTYGEFQLLSQDGSIMIPKVGASEPLKAQGQYFIDCVEKGTTCGLVDAQKGCDVVKTLCAIDQSMEQKGACVNL